MKLEEAQRGDENAEVAKRMNKMTIFTRAKRARKSSFVSSACRRWNILHTKMY